MCKILKTIFSKSFIYFQKHADILKYSAERDTCDITDYVTVTTTKLTLTKLFL